VTGSEAAAPLPRQPRALGAARVTARLREGRSVLGALAERGSAKVRLPRTDGPPLEAVLLNTAGGVTGGDRFDWRAEAGPGARLVLANQTAERAYRAQPGTTGRIATRLTLGAGATLEWLAQETILFDGCAFDRRLEVEMAADARLLLVESLVFGREAMGETVRAAAVHDSQRIVRDGRLIYADAFRAAGPVADILSRPAALGGARACATLLYAAPDAADRLDDVRAGLDGAQAGASYFDGMISARIVAADGQALRRRLTAFLRGFRGIPLPRVWEM
jgi:urease accessory protein